MFEGLVRAVFFCESLRTHSFPSFAVLLFPNVVAKMIVTIINMVVVRLH